MSSETLKQRSWSVLAYTVAQDERSTSPLDLSAQGELKALCAAADFDRVSVAAQVDFKRTPGVFRGVLTPRPDASFQEFGFETVLPEDYRLWHAIQESIRNSTLHVEKDVRDLNSARQCVVANFLRYGTRECPADHFLLYFYGHSCGPMGLFYDTDPDQRRARTLRLTELEDALSAVERKATIILFRDCFMNTLETAYQLRTVGEYMIASQSTVPIAGLWPWTNFMATLIPSTDCVHIARAVAIQLAKFLEEPTNRGDLVNVPYSLIDMTKIDRIREPLAALVRALEAAAGDVRRRAACGRALEESRVGFPDDPTNPGDPALVDVLTMCDKLQALGFDDVTAPAKAVSDVVRQHVLRWHHPEESPHRGTSLYYRPATAATVERSFIEPSAHTESDHDAVYYSELALSRDTGWDRVVLHPLAGEVCATRGVASGS